MPARYETIARWVNTKRWKTGAELGVFDGSTLLYLLANCPRLSLIAVDVWDPTFREGRIKSGERCFCEYCNETRRIRKIYPLSHMERNVINRASGSGRTQILKMTTSEASKYVPDGSLDFVFIDADHSTEGVTEDINRWIFKLKKNGRMIGHDWNMKSVRDAVSLYFSKEIIRTEDDHLWWVDC